jgi:hypothetical protein
MAGEKCGRQSDRPLDVAGALRCGTVGDHTGCFRNAIEAMGTHGKRRRWQGLPGVIAGRACDQKRKGLRIGTGRTKGEGVTVSERETVRNARVRLSSALNLLMHTTLPVRDFQAFVEEAYQLLGQVERSADTPAEGVSISSEALKSLRVILEVIHDMDRACDPAQLAAQALEILKPPARPSRPKHGNAALPLDPEVSETGEVCMDEPSLVERCTIQEGCMFPAGHMGNCVSVKEPTYQMLKPCAVHDFPSNPAPWNSGKLTYYICTLCRCVKEHEAHGWKNHAHPGGLGEATAADLRNAMKAPARAESIDQLLMRMAQVVPEPSLMDIEDGSGSQMVLLQRFATLAQLHQAKQLELCADRLNSIVTELRIADAAGRGHGKA